MRTAVDIVELWANLARAYEVALLGNFSIRVVLAPEYPQGHTDYKDAKAFYRNVQFSSDGDLTILLHRPDYNQAMRRRGSETLKDIEDRVEEARKNMIPTDLDGESCIALLENATEKQNLSYRTRRRILKIAGVIAQLEGSKLVKVHHLAEAIQYATSYRNTRDAEDAFIYFGPGIRIAITRLEEEDITNAINALQSLYDSGKSEIFYE